jgi:hypothetical protein
VGYAPRGTPRGVHPAGYAGRTSRRAVGISAYPRTPQGVPGIGNNKAFLSFQENKVLIEI